MVSFIFKNTHSKYVNGNRTLIHLNMKNLVNYSDLQSTSKQMLDDIYRISESLTTQFDTDKSSYTRQMNAFVSSAAERVRNVRDGIIAADMKLKEVQTFYGEGDGAGVGRGMQSQDFFGIFRTFTSSYKVGKGCLSILHRANISFSFFDSFAKLKIGPGQRNRRHWKIARDVVRNAKRWESLPNLQACRASRHRAISKMSLPNCVRRVHRVSHENDRKGRLHRLRVRCPSRLIFRRCSVGWGWGWGWTQGMGRK